MAEVILPRNEIPIRATRLSLADVVRVYERLERVLKEQALIEVAAVNRRPDQTEKQFDEWKRVAEREAFKTTVSIIGRDGTSLFGDSVSVFSSAILPKRIDRIYLTNMTAYRAFAGTAPTNFFELMLDFSKPPLLDANTFVSSPTPNISLLTVQGNRDSWVAAATDAVLGITSVNKTRRGWLHRSFIYDAGLFSVGLPIALYICWMLSGFINSQLSNVHSVVAGAAYIYVVLASLVGYRALFGYTKWVFPTMELTDNKDSDITHRTVLGTIVIGLAGRVLYDVINGLA